MEKEIDNEVGNKMSLSREWYMLFLFPWCDRTEKLQVH